MFPNIKNYKMHPCLIVVFEANTRRKNHENPTLIHVIQQYTDSSVETPYKEL